jgi:hypothetical protein
VATSEGRLLATRPARDGALWLSRSGDASKVTSVNLDFREPRRTRVSGLLTAFAWLFLGLLAVCSNFATAKWQK